jgi:broad specificity phosphatase PhoE
VQFYLVRHALPDFSAGGAYHLPPGPPLTDTGREQAAAVARLLARAPIARVVSSPLRRCLMTAEPLCGLLGLDLQVDPDLGEQQPGEVPTSVALRMVRAVLNQSEVPGVVLVSHAGPLEQLLGALVQERLVLPPPDARGCRLAVASVWHVQRREGRWQARPLAPAAA